MRLGRERERKKDKERERGVWPTLLADRQTDLHFFCLRGISEPLHSLCKNFQGLESLRFPLYFRTEPRERWSGGVVHSSGTFSPYINIAHTHTNCRRDNEEAFNIGSVLKIAC